MYTCTTKLWSPKRCAARDKKNYRCELLFLAAGDKVNNQPRCTTSCRADLHWDVGARKPSALAVGARLPAVTLQFPTCEGVRAMRAQEVCCRAPLQNWQAMGVRRGVRGMSYTSSSESCVLFC